MMREYHVRFCEKFGVKLPLLTRLGQICQKCNKSQDECICKELEKNKITGDGIVKISRSTKGRKGKGVTIISGLALTLSELESLGKELRKKCGTGGSVKNNNIEIQGEYREFILKELQKRGWKAKVV